MPDMTPHAKQITEAIHVLVLAAEKIVAESTDDVSTGSGFNIFNN